VSPDVVIVGGGIIGACAALELARAGLAVTVVEKTAVGLGSTAASSACIRQGFGRAEAIELARDGLLAWEAWREHAEVPAAEPAARFSRTGVLYLGEDQEKLRREAELMASRGARAELWGANALRGRYADWELAGIHAALWEPEGGWVEGPDLAARNAMDAACARGAVLVVDRVVAVEVTGGRVSGVTLARAGRLPCGAVLNAAGPWSAGVNAMAGVALPLRALRHRTALLPVEGGSSDLPIVADFAAETYFRPEPGRAAILVGSFDEINDAEPEDDADHADPGVDRAYYEAKALLVAARMPERVRLPPWTRGVAGLYDVHEPDWYPVIGPTTLDGFFIAAGTSGAWFKGGPSIAVLIRHVVTRASGPVLLPRTGTRLDARFFRCDRAPITTPFAGGVVG